MSTEVSSQAVYVVATQDGLRVSEQTTYAALMSAILSTTGTTAYVAMFEELAPVAKRRRTFIP